MKSVIRAYVLILAVAILAWPPGAQAQSAQSRNANPEQATPQAHTGPLRASNKARVNAGTVGFVADTVSSTNTRMTSDIAAVFDNGDKLRILPVLGRGALQSITDILYLRGIDFGIVQSDVLKYIKDERIYPSIENRINYITKLHNQEFHIIAGKGIGSLADLNGRKVNIGIRGSGSHITATAVFKASGVEVDATEYDEANALDKLRLGEIAAMVYVAGKPAPLFAQVAADQNLHLVPVPFNDKLGDYLPAKFTAADYPGLVESGKTVPTIAVRAVLAVFNWAPGSERYKKVVNFISTFFTKFSELRKPPRHPKWREVNIHAKVPGWRRFPPASEWVARNARQVAENRIKMQPKKDGRIKQAFLKFLNSRRGGRAQSRLKDPDVNELFEQFVKWQRAQPRSAN